jgi:hypothetical protein
LDGFGIAGRAVFDIFWGLVKDLPGQEAKAMSDGPDGLFVTEPGQESAIAGLE